METARKTEREHQPLTERRRVLYLDEDVEHAFRLNTLLKLSHYDPVTVNFASDALRLADNERFDLFIFSRRFPVDAGAYLSRKLHEIAPGTPVLFLSEQSQVPLNLPSDS